MMTISSVAVSEAKHPGGLGSTKNAPPLFVATVVRPMTLHAVYDPLELSKSTQFLAKEETAENFEWDFRITKKEQYDTSLLGLQCMFCIILRSDECLLSKRKLLSTPGPVRG